MLCDLVSQIGLSLGDTAVRHDLALSGIFVHVLIVKALRERTNWLTVPAAF